MTSALFISIYKSKFLQMAIKQTDFYHPFLNTSINHAVQALYNSHLLFIHKLLRHNTFSDFCDFATTHEKTQLTKHFAVTAKS